MLTGIDVVMRDQRNVLAGQRLGLVTNPTGRAASGASTIDVLHAAPDWHLAALFSPEHGIRGEADAGQSVVSTVDAQTGLPVYSLYGQTTRPTPAMLQGLDTLVYDIQDVGARVYTYTSTLLEVMRAAADHQVRVVVLDRPVPINGDDVEGNVLDPAFTSFVGPAPIAMRYGMTIGELGTFFNAELQVGADLQVVPLQGWQRGMWFDQTGLTWVNPSPNLRSLSAATVYPGTVLFEGTNISEGRGTDRPFEWIGAPWLDGGAWAAALSESGLVGVALEPAVRTPDSSKFAGQPCEGVEIHLVDRARVEPMLLGLAMLGAAIAQAGSKVQINASTFDALAGTDQVRRALQAGQPAADIAASWQTALQNFRTLRSRYLRY